MIWRIETALFLSTASAYSERMSNIPRLFIDSPLVSGQSITLPEGQAHYLARVMRLGGGDIARVFNGKDGEWACELEIEGRKVFATPAEQLRKQPATLASGPKLLFAPLKKTRTDFAVEKATELGASLIQPVGTAYTQTHRVKSERLTALAIEAAEQTERMDLPVIGEKRPLFEALAGWSPDAPLIFCDEAGDALPMIDALNNVTAPAGGGLLIGPEGGFAPDEREALRKHSFVVPVTLGPRILRAETAIVSALTIWQTVLGDWR